MRYMSFLHYSMTSRERWDCLVRCRRQRNDERQRANALGSDERRATPVLARRVVRGFFGVASGRVDADALDGGGSATAASPARRLTRRAGGPGAEGQPPGRPRRPRLCPAEPAVLPGARALG